MQKKNSVTLMELIIAMSIATFLIGAVITYNLIGEKFYHSTSKQATLLNDAQYLMRQIGKDFKEAEDVKFINNTAKVASIDSGKTIEYEFVESAREIRYSNSAKDIDNELFASNVELFSIEYPDPDRDNFVRVEIHLLMGEISNAKTKEESHYVTTFCLRNKEP